MIDDQKHKASARGNVQARRESAKEMTAAQFLRLAKTNLRDGRQKEAFVLLQRAAVCYPHNPVVLSYFGCLQTLVDKKYRSGIETCKQAIALLRNSEEEEKENLYSLFYLNLGRAYLAAGKKQDAINAFTTGLKHDSGNADLHQELRGLGRRKQPPISFLERSNPINKLIGMILHTTKKRPEKARGTRT
jgi:tetratricopeptide (TPR) repeat protein